MREEHSQTMQPVLCREVLSIVEVDEGGLPEFLCMHGRPSQAAAGDLGLPLVEGGELEVVLTEVLVEALEDFLDFFVDPGAVPQLDYQVEGVDHGEVLKASLVLLQVL